MRGESNGRSLEIKREETGLEKIPGRGKNHKTEKDAEKARRKITPISEPWLPALERKDRSFRQMKQKKSTSFERYLLLG